MEYLQYRQGLNLVLLIGIVLNLIINGIPSILFHKIPRYFFLPHLSFKPYYKWNTFNTILEIDFNNLYLNECFKPYYKWNTFNT